MHTRACRVVRGKLGPLIEHWQKIALLAERLIRRREAAAVRSPNALFKRSFLSSILTPSVAPPPPSGGSDAASMLSASVASLASSVYGPNSMIDTLTTSPISGADRPDGAADGGFYTSYWENPQADLSRLTMTLNALNENNTRCWRGDDCDLCSGVRSGLDEVSRHVGKHSDDADQRVNPSFSFEVFLILMTPLQARVMIATTLEAIKVGLYPFSFVLPLILAQSQRDLYIATRDLFIRHDRLSGDNVERLKKRIETTQMKLEGIRAAQKEGWAQEVDRLTTVIERDQLTIQQLLNRRIFIRYSCV